MNAVAFTQTSSLSGVRVQQRSTAKAARSVAIVRCQAVQEADSRRKVLGLGLLFAASAASPAWAGKLDGQGKLDGPTRSETLAGPKDTQGELVKAPASAPTKPAVAKGPKPTADIKEGQGLIAQLLEKSAANKELNDKKRLATSYANLAGSRTVADGTCAFPNNLFGCDNRTVAGKVKYIAQDRDLECQGKPDGLCGEKIQTKYIPKALAK